MALRVNLRQLEKKNLVLEGELSAAELGLEDEDELIHIPAPVEYHLEVQRFERSLLVTGRLHLALQCECARCLRPFAVPLDFPDWTLLLPLEGEDRVAVENDGVDLTPYVREDILLAFPQHPLCDAGCAGLANPSAGGASQARGSGQAADATSAWAVLNKLKL